MTDPVQNPYISPNSDDANVSSQTINGIVRIGQMITFALAQGVLIITAIIYFLVVDEPAAVDPNTPPAGAGDWVLPGIGICAAIGACVIAFVLSGMLRRLAIRKYRSSQTAASSPPTLASKDNVSKDTVLTYPMERLMQESMTGTLTVSYTHLTLPTICSV